MTESGSKLKTRVMAGLFWKLLENGGTQGVQFLVSVILARLLMPEEYQILSLITIFISVANVFIQTGFSTALVQKKEADALDFSSVLYLSLGVAAVIYVLLYVTAPAISAFYEAPLLKSSLRVLALVLFVGAINSVQNAVIVRELRFKQLFLSGFSAVVLSGALGIGMALVGCGVWALVGQQLSYQVFLCLILWFTIRWRPLLAFSLRRVGTLFGFGWKLLTSSLLDTLYNNVYGLIIGKICTDATLAYYNRGDVFPQVIATNVNGAIQTVMLPVMAQSQEDPERVKAMMKRAIKSSSFLVVPMMAGLMAVAEPMVSLLLTDKWLPAVPFLRILCLSYAFWPIHTANLQAINAMGRSDVYLKLELVKKAIGITFLLIGLPFGVYVMVALKPVVSVISTFVNAWPNRRLLHYGLREQWLDILPVFLLSAVMGLAVYAISFLGLGTLTTLCIQILTGVILYVGLAWLLRLETLRYLLCSLRELRSGR